MKTLYIVPFALIILQSCSFAYQSSPVRELPVQVVDESDQIPSDTMVNIDFPQLPF